MIINYSDEENRLDEQIRKYFHEAACCVIAQELPGVIESGMLPDAVPVEISVTVTDGEEIRAINREYRDVDSVTDVLSFPQYNDREQVAAEIGAHDAEGFDIPLGDVVLCYDRATEQAKEYGNSNERELTYLFVHSMLHLLGYDHMEADEKAVMRMHEESVMEGMGLGR